MDISVRHATHGDLSFVGQDGYIKPEEIQRKIDRGEVLLAEVEGEPAGYLRVEFLWSMQPYLSLIRVLDRYRRRGVSRALLGYLEDTLRTRGHSVLFSSSQVDEAEPQAWHRHMGFEESGVINGLNEGGVGELFFRRVF